MKHLHITAILISAFLLSHGQSTEYGPLYNPDSNSDQFIGVPDLISLLALFGSEFEATNLVLNSDSTAALLYLGQTEYIDCKTMCMGQLGEWWMITYDDFLEYSVEAASIAQVVEFPQAWIDDEKYWENSILPQINSGSGEKQYKIWIEDYTAYGGEVHPYKGAIGYEPFGTNDEPATQACICATKQMVSIENSTCSGPAETFNACLTTKAQEGWRPVGGASVSNIAGPFYIQSFWRKAID